MRLQKKFNVLMLSMALTMMCLFLFVYQRASSDSQDIQLKDAQPKDAAIAHSTNVIKTVETSVTHVNKIIQTLIAPVAPRSSIVKSSLPQRTPLKPKLDLNYYYKTCGYNVIFNQTEVDGICAPEPAAKPSVCPAVRIDHLSHGDFRSTLLKLPPGADGQASLPMFVHPAKDYISNSIVSTGGWDAGGVGAVTRALIALPGAALVDIGCNLGVFSLRAAHLGRRVVSIDANYQNVIRLRKSVLANNLDGRVQIFWNALATEPGSLKMRLPTDCNIGGGIPTELLQPHWFRDPVEVRTAGLDDLLVGSRHLNGTIDVVIKIDIEGCEWGAIATASETFSRYRVPMVLMEWRGTQIFHPEKADFLLDFFAKRNYTAYNLFGKKQPPVALSNGDHKTWPGDVLWLNAQGHMLLSLFQH